MKNLFASVILIILTVLLFGCEKWNAVELSTGCFDEFPTSGFLYGQEGKVQAVTENDQANLVIVRKPDGVSSLFFPCNLPPEYQKQGLEIKFDAEIKNIPDQICDTITPDSIHCISIDILGTPVTFTSLEVKD